MLFCNKHFEKEFHRVEKWVKFIAIPFFTIITVFFLTPYPFAIERDHLIYHIAFSFAGVLGIWVSVRMIIFYFRKHCPKLNATFRISVQLLITSILSVGIILLLHVVGKRYIPHELDYCEPFSDHFDFKNLLLTSILFTFLVNTIYEGFYLSLRLSETALETERYKKESIQAQYQNLTSRLNPHFLFNSLNTLTTIVEEDQKKAVAYIQELSMVYRYVLNSQKSTWIDLPSELKFTQSYITLLRMRFEEDIIIEMDICEKHTAYYILPLTVQLLIENAVKHNEISITKPLHIKIFCNEEELVVSNNKQKRNIMPSTTKIGLSNISERYGFLVNKEVIIEDMPDTFTVHIPLIKKADAENRFEMEEEV